MTFTVPNLSGSIEDPTGVYPQAQLDSVDLQILGAAAGGQNGVSSGCAVTAQGSPDNTVAVAAGTVVVAGVEVAVTGGNLTMTAAHASLNRFDLITVNNSGTKAYTAGTAATAPVFPAIPANSVVLAAIYVPDTDNVINTAQIVDKRVSVRTPLGASGWTTISKAADQTKTSDTALADDSTLKFAMAAATVYRIRGTIFVDTESATPDFKYQLLGPTIGAGRIRIRRRTANDAGALTDATGTDTSYAGTAGSIASTGAMTGATLEFEAVITNGANSGTFSVQWAQNTTSADDTTVLSGSYIEYAIA